MSKFVAILVGIAVLGSPALAQVRPQDCRPALPVVDQVSAIPQDLVAERAIPAAAVKRGFFGLPLLPLLLAGGAGCIIACGGGGSGNGSGTPVSPS